MENTKVFKVAVEHTCNNVTAKHVMHVTATTKYHAIELAWAMHYDIQPNREKYTIVNVRSREQAMCIAVLAMSAFNYTLNFS